MRTAARATIALLLCTSLFYFVHLLFRTPLPNATPSEQTKDKVQPERPLFNHFDTFKKIRLEFLLEDAKEETNKAEISDKPYWRWTPIAVIDSRQRYKGAILSALPALIENGEAVRLEWRNIPGPSRRKNSDWIGLFCPSSSPSNRYIDYWPVSDLMTDYPSSHGEANLVLYNVRTDCEFRYFTNDSYVEMVAVSNKVTFVDGAEAPLHVHLALTGDASEMRVQWTTGVQYTPTVEYGECGGKLDKISTGTWRTYKASDMCGPPANLSAHFISPGYLHDVVLTGLKPHTRYCYRCGNPQFKYSGEKSFTSPIPPGSDTPFKFVAYGDMDTSLPPGSFATAAHIRQDIEDYGVSMVMHIGDLSYAVGLAYRWEEWMTQLEPYSSLAPYMVSIGNHEQEHIVGGEKDPSHAPGNGFHPSWGNYGHDSGGECGVPVYNRFHMPENGNQPWWYSFEYGLVHFTVLSTEHDFTVGSRQHTWLVDDLKSVDRSRTPWLIVNIHRPMYSSERYLLDYTVSTHIRRSLEPVFHEYRVDMAICGHYHSYERTCKVYKEKCIEDGTVHVIVGAAGFHLDSAGVWPFDWSRHYEAEFGYGRVTVANSTSLLWEYVRNRDKKVSDHVWLHHS